MATPDASGASGGLSAAALDVPVASTSNVNADPRDENQDFANDSATPPPAKRRKPARTALGKVKGRRGALKAFNSLPLDLVLDICTYLDPADLYTLSKTTKVFRTVVTGPTSAQLWSDARARVGLPELKCAMTDLQYAALLFERGCHYCKRPNAGKPDVYYRVRVCGSCIKECFANPATSKGVKAINLALPRPHPVTLEIATQSGVHGRESKLINLQDTIELDELLSDEFPEATWADRHFIQDKKEAAGWSLPDPIPETPIQQWLNDEVWPRRVARIDDGRALSLWLDTQERMKHLSKEDLRKKRREDIESRLKAIGFGPADFMGTWAKDPLVKKPELLTERMWAKIGPLLKQKLLDNRRANRTHNMKLCLGLSLASKRPLFEYVAPYGSMALLLPTVQRLVNDDSTAATGTELFHENVEAILDDATALIRSRFYAMIRCISHVYQEVDDAQHCTPLPDDVAPRRADPAVEELSDIDIDLPRLPSWIPRDPEAPIKASDVQMAEFLKSHDLATFACRACRQLISGVAAIKHFAHPWEACTSCGPSGSGEASATPDEWIPIETSPTRGLTLDPTIMLRSLKLKELAENVELTCVDATIDARLAEVEVPSMHDQEKYVVKYACSCGCVSTRPSYFSNAHDMIEGHQKLQSGKVKLVAKVEYSPAYKARVATAYFAELESRRYDRYDRYDSEGYSDEDGYRFDTYGRGPYLGYDSYDDLSDDHLEDIFYSMY